MGLLELKAKLTKHPVKAIIFRENLGITKDYAGRVGTTETYHLLRLKHKLPSPPSTEYFYTIEGKPTIFLYSPRLGTYYYIRIPKTSFNPETNTMDVKYVVRVKDKKTGNLIEGKFKTETITVKIKKEQGKDGKTIKANKKDDNREVETTFELFDHDDLNFLASETQRSESKYEKKLPWWKENIHFLLTMGYFIAIAVGIWIVYEQVVFPSAGYAIQHTVKCIVANSTI